MSSINVQKVHPGDLITASFFNSIVDALNTLQTEIDALGAVGSPPVSVGAKPVIDSVAPSPDVPAGATMTIHGHNFAVPASSNTVTVDGTPLNDFQGGSTDEVINIDIPGNLPGVPGTKALVVSTAAGGPSNPMNVHFVAPQIVLGGQAQLTNISGNIGTITVAPPPVLFQFQLDGTALNEPEQFRIVATYTNPVGATQQQWNDATTYIGTSGTDHEATVTPLAPVNVGVQVAVPTGATSVQLSVQAVSVHNDPASSSVPVSIPISVGSAPPPADPSMSIVLGTNLRPNLHPNTTGDGLDIRYGTTAVITVDTTMGHAGDYQFTGAIENPDTSVWQILDLPQTLHYSDGQGQQLQFRLQLVPTAPPTSSVTRNFTLTATRQNTDSIGAISNFLRFKIGGFV